MQKVKEFCSSKYFTWFLLGIGALVILAYYFIRVPDLYVYWSLVDEYGYLANAAYLSNTDWSWLTNMYYGYGYSLWLVPLFWVCDSGVGMLRAAVMFNAICIVALFFIQYMLMSKLCKNTGKNMLIVISFALCFYPYIVFSGVKVMCEIMLTLVVWLCGLLLYQALETGKWYYYVLSGAVTVYMFYVHARAIVFCAVIVLVVGIMFLAKKVNWKQLLAFAVPAAILFVLGYLLRNQIVDVVYSQELFESAAAAGESTVEIGNNMSLAYVLDKVSQLFQPSSLRLIFVFFGRNFYLFVGTLGMFHVGVAASVAEAVKEFKNKKSISTVNAIKLMYTLGAMLMVFATTIQSLGLPENGAYSFYGRYYEFMIVPAAFLGIDYCMNNKLKIRNIIAWLLTFGVLIWLTMELANWISTQDMTFDAGRLASFAMYSVKEVYFRAVVRAAAKFTLACVLVIILLNYKEKLRKLIPIVLIAVFALNDHVIMENVLNLHAEFDDDYQVAVYVHTYYPDKDEIYFVNADVIYPIAYTGIQASLGQEKLTMIEGKNADVLESGDVFVSFRNNQYLELIEEPITKMWETQYYELYVVE
ncbi:MAG: hypothetical protein IJZ23_09050 [Roseburia sp.]|nr:hypothetical protein [Roseburia sp.]